MCVVATACLEYNCKYLHKWLEMEGLLQYLCENIFKGMLLDATLVVLFFNRPFWWHFLSKYCQKFVSTWTDEINQARHASDDRTLRRPFLSSAVDRDTALFYRHTSNCALETVHTSTVWKCAQDFAIFFQAPDTFLMTVLSFKAKKI